MRTLTSRLVHLCLSAFLAATFAAAAGAAESGDVIKYRQALMKGQAGYMGAIAQIVKDKVPFEARMVTYAYGLAGLVVAIEEAFPPGTDFGEVETKALDDIWKDFDDFKAKAQDAVNAAEGLVNAAESGDRRSWGPAFEKMGEACKGCHKKYRKKDE